ncbi:MAG: Gfo/Idh/MocA family oxidoreductase [Armatimonadetes bacterium]|nr:Gfo/Idh/MocA family oxidoreductase [Armatimonadota bacterium]
MHRKVRFGIIGCGGIAKNNHIPGLQAIGDKAEITALCDVNLDAAKKVGEGIPGAAVYDSVEKMLAGTGLDAVCVSTPNKYHAEPTILALQKGLHVLCEKPMATTGAEAKRMVEAAKKANKVLQIGLQLRFGGPASFMRDYVKSGEMGEIYYARAWALRRRGVPNWGVFIDKGEQGGGALIDIGVHILDLTLHLMGYPKPVSASALTFSHLGTNPDLYNHYGPYDRERFTVEDMAVALVRFEDNRAISLESSFMANLEGNPYQTQLFGTGSGAIVSPFAEPNIQIFTERNQMLFNQAPANVSKPAMNVEQMKAFLARIEGKETPAATMKDGYTLASIIDAIYKSADTGKEEPVLGL